MYGPKEADRALRKGSTTGSEVGRPRTKQSIHCQSFLAILRTMLSHRFHADPRFHDLHEQRVFSEGFGVLVDGLGDVTAMNAEQKLH